MKIDSAALAVVIAAIIGALSSWGITRRALRVQQQKDSDQLEIELHGQEDSFILKGSKQLIDALQDDHRRLRQQNEELAKRVARMERQHNACLDRLDRITTDHAAIVGWIRESVRRRSEHEAEWPELPELLDRPQGTEGQ